MKGRKNMKKIIPVIIAAFLVSCRNQQFVNPPFISLLNAEIPTAYSSGTFYAIIDEGLISTNMDIHSAAGSRSVIGAVRGDAIYRVDVTNGALSLTSLTTADRLFADNCKIITTDSERLSVYDGTNLSASYALSQHDPRDWDSVEIWGKFLIVREGNDLSILNALDTLPLKSTLTDIDRFAVADDSPYIVFTRAETSDIYQYNLYSGMTVTLLENPLPDGVSVQKLKYYDRLQILFIIGETSLGVFHLDTGRSEMGSLSVDDVVYDNNRNILYALTEESIYAVYGVSGIAESISEGNYRTFLLNPASIQ